MCNVISFIVLAVVSGMLLLSVLHGLTTVSTGEKSMGYLFRPPKTRRNPVTGKKERVRNAKGEIVLSEMYHGQWIDYTGRRATRALSTSKSVATKMLADLVAQSRAIALGSTALQITYRAAMETGLRANELRHLQSHHLDAEQGGIRLDAAWTKNRKDGFQPISKALLVELVEYAKGRNAEKEYEAAFSKGGHEATWPENPLLYVPRNCATTMDRDLAAAGIPKVTAAGKLDFHCWRNVYINNVIATGADVKTVQTLARHSSPELSFNVYGRSVKERLASTVEEAARQLYFGLKDESGNPEQAPGE